MTVWAGGFVERFDAVVEQYGRQPALYYFDYACDYAALNRDSDALAAAFAEMGVQVGDRIAVALQNVPGFVLGFLAAAKIGAITVPINPMYKQGELAAVLGDSEPRLLICHDDFAAAVVSKLENHPPILLVSEYERQSRNDRRVLPEPAPLSQLGERLEQAVADRQGEKPPRHRAGPDDLRLIVYTSGTTGKPKGAMITERNLCSGGDFYCREAQLDNRDAVLGLAPLFHVTGISGHIAASLLSGSPLILCYRFHPAMVLDTIAERRPGFTVAAITALAALIDSPAFESGMFSPFRQVFSGGAPIPPSLHDRFRDKTGIAIRNVYGLTETSAPITAGLDGEDTPVDPVSGALSIGKAVLGAQVLVLNDTGQQVANGDVGEIVVRGPSVVPGYWRQPEATAQSMRGEGFFTGDVGCMDAQGWLYLVDRKKDMIVASGFKVWPREVEDVLYRHPAVSEAAVVGIPDDYRGESVKAVVSLHTGSDATDQELIAFCRERLAAYKCPRFVEFLDELPKTITGKILRRSLR